MAAETIIVEASSAARTKRWAFTYSMTGQLDYAGVTEKAPAADCCVIEGSTYFSPAWYTWLPENLCARICVYLPAGLAPADTGMYSYLTHIGAVLLAVEEKDTLLAAELISRRSEIFFKYAQLTMYIIEPVAAEALFALVYGSKGDNSDFEHYYAGGGMFSVSVTSASVLFYEAAKKRLAPEPQKETPEEMFIRFFKTQHGVQMTLGIMGACFHRWAEQGIPYISRITERSTGDDFVSGTEKVRSARAGFFSSIGVSVQAEPYNPHDVNAIAVFLDDIQSKISGCGGKVHAGYIRATGAAVLRKAFPQKYSFPAGLARMGDSQDGSEGIVVRISL